jgi:sulfur-oxidizing protein SoxZ
VAAPEAATVGNPGDIIGRPAVADPIRIRAKTKDAVTEVLVLMPHPMETGLRKNDAGALIDAHYITDVRIAVAGRSVLEARMSMAVSRDPLVSFRFRGGQAGDRISVTWTDNKGDQRTDETVIA